MINRNDRTENTIVGHIPRELSRFAFLIDEGESVTGTISSSTPFPGGKLDVLITMDFVY